MLSCMASPIPVLPGTPGVDAGGCALNPSGQQGLKHGVNDGFRTRNPSDHNRVLCR